MTWISFSNNRLDSEQFEIDGMNAFRKNVDQRKKIMYYWVNTFNTFNLKIEINNTLLSSALL